MPAGKKRTKTKPKKESKYDFTLSVDASMDELLLAGLSHNPKTENIKKMPDKFKTK